MSEIVATCPRCKAKEITFDLLTDIPLYVKYKWQYWFEAFCVCRACNRSTIFVLSQRDINDKVEIKNGLSSYSRAVNQIVKIEGHISLKDIAAEQPPEHLPKQIEAAFREGAACMAIACHNAAATMFRLCIDLATKDMLPVEEVEGLNRSTRRNLGLRLPWLFDNGLLPEALRELSTCIKDNGNDGAHDGTLGEEDAADILDFTFVLLERIYTEQKRIELAKERRNARR
ncbi:DUF4145 domain-containing protein [Geopsychrobacter electrodiphilus]|uniref:DUF4145 domain-containing protein n=1 Tax=Geopsychrobacter electrodiphilus TaxID=225196 RepID=UPI00036F0D9B|nr:DUF4145 domain-containing protein [Geopsychrobacter electrodiphilus]